MSNLQKQLNLNFELMTGHEYFHTECDHRREKVSSHCVIFQLEEDFFPSSFCTAKTNASSCYSDYAETDITSFSHDDMNNRGYQAVVSATLQATHGKVSSNSWDSYRQLLALSSQMRR